MSQESVKGISIYIDMRNSTKLNKKSKIKEIRKFYNTFNNYELVMSNISLTYQSLIGDGILMFFKCSELNDELFTLLEDMSDKVKKISHNNIKYGIGIAYGEISNEIHMVNGSNQNIPIGTSVDLAAKASDLGNKGSDKVFCIFLKNKAKTISSELNLELRNFIEKNKKQIKGKTSSSGNNYRFDFIE